jgi:hypothetical protein
MEVSRSEPDTALFEMTFRPKPELITAVRRFVASVYVRLRLSSELADQVMLVTHEMLENATRHSIDGLATITMDVRGSREHPAVTIRTINRVSDEDRERVASALAEIAKQDDPHQFYIDLVRRSLKVESVGGVGLGRIVAEGEMDLSMSSKDDVLELTAVHRGAAPVSASA